MDEVNASTHMVFEVRGRSADERGYDCLVCKSLGDALSFVQSDMEDAEPGQSTTITFAIYTQDQMDEVYE